MSCSTSTRPRRAPRPRPPIERSARSSARTSTSNGFSTRTRMPTTSWRRRTSRKRLARRTLSAKKAHEIVALWQDFYNTPGAFEPEADFDRLFADGDTFKIGDLDVRVMLSPGHTLGVVTLTSSDCRAADLDIVSADADTFQHQLQASPLPARDHRTRGLAVCSVQSEPPRGRGDAAGARRRRFL